MVKQAIKLILIFMIIGAFIPSAMAHNYESKSTYHKNYDQKNGNYDRIRKVIKLNAMERVAYGTYMRTLGHRYIASYRYREYNQTSQPRYFVMSPSRAKYSSARSYWP